MLFKEDEVARAQHNAVRNTVGWFRWTHDLVVCKGDDAEQFLDYMLVNKVAGLALGRGKYTTMLNAEGKIIDDLVVFRIGENEFWLSTLYGPHMVRWFDEHKEGYSVQYEDITPAWDMYAIQGPLAAKLTDEVCADAVDDLKRFQIIDTTIDGVEVKVDRGGFTGEVGFEIYCPREVSEKVSTAIAREAEKFDAPELDVLEVYVRALPMEKGMGLRQDYYGLTPFEAGLGWSVHMDKDFLGKDALSAIAEDEPKRAFVGIEIERESYEDIAQGEIVYKRGVPVGFVRAMIYGYTVDKNIGFAIVDEKKCPIGTLVKIGQNMSPAVVVEPKWL